VIAWDSVGVLLQLPQPAEATLKPPPLPALAAASHTLTPWRSQQGGRGGAAAAAFEPYQRAVLGSWLRAAVSGSGSGASSSTAALGSGEALLDSGCYLGAGPRSIADVSCTGLEICVPHDREPGPAQRYASMHISALQAVSACGLRKRRGLLACPPSKHTRREQRFLLPFKELAWLAQRLLCALHRRHLPRS
jgi:hypothetical protein